MVQGNAAWKQNLRDFEPTGSDPGFQRAVAVFVESETSLADQVEGDLVDGEIEPIGPAQTRIRDLLGPSWDDDSLQLRQNLTQVLSEIVRAAQRREYPTVASRGAGDPSQ